jgi:hypothetical protein
MKTYKLVFTVPLSHADVVREAIGKVGAGRLGDYSFCSFSTRGVGRFIPNADAHPHIGEAGTLEQVEEERVECNVSAEVLDNVIAALKRTHPYEEIAYDLYPLEISNR